MNTHRALTRLSFGTGAGSGSRVLPEEVAVALSFNGTTQAVMMATPADLEDFAYGFALTEGLAQPSEIEGIHPQLSLLRPERLVNSLFPVADDLLRSRHELMPGHPAGFPRKAH